MTTVPQLGLRKLQDAWDRFFFGETDAFEYSHLRIVYAMLVLLHNAIMYPSLKFYFSESGILPYDVSRRIIGQMTTTIFGVLPHTDFVMYAVWWTWTASAVFLMLGVFSRVSAIVAYVCMVSFHHRNNLVTDGEDTMFRIVGLLLIFLPHGKMLSFDRTVALLRGSRSPEASARKAWPCALRILQFYMSFMMFSACWWKLKGSEWVNGTSMYYVSRLDDFFGRYPMPAFPFEYLPITRVMTWSVLWVEGLVPFLVWFKETRKYALAVMAGFHIACDYTMNLFLFHWVMLLGWSSFLAEGELRKAGAWFGTWFSKLGLKPVMITYDAAHAPGRRAAAVLTEWDLFSLLRFEEGKRKEFQVNGVTGIQAIRKAIHSLPAAWWMLPLTYLPGISTWSGWPGPTPAKLRRAS